MSAVETTAYGPAYGHLAVDQLRELVERRTGR
jgi:hypothetical protein